MTDRWDFKRFFSTPNPKQAENLYPKTPILPQQPKPEQKRPSPLFQEPTR